MLLVVDAFLSFRETPSWKFLFLYILWGALGFYILIFNAVLFLVLNVYALFVWRRNWVLLKKWVLGQVILAGIVAAWIPVFLGHAEKAGHVFAVPGLMGYVTGIPLVFYQLSVGMTVARDFMGGVISFRELIYIGVALLVFSAPLFLSAKELFRRREGGFLALWVILFPVIFLLAWILLNFEFEPRYMLGSVSGYFLLVAFGCSRFKNFALKWGCIGAVVGLNLVSLYNYHFSDHYRRQALRPATQFIEKNAGPDSVVFYSGRTPFPWYHTRDDIQSFEVSSEKTWSLFSNEMKSKEGFWVIVSQKDLWVDEWLSSVREKYEEISVKTLPGNRITKVFYYAHR